MAHITSFSQYAALAVRTAAALPYEKQIEHAQYGVLTELGELADIFKRIAVYGKPYTDKSKLHVTEEIGDALWYVALYVVTRKFPESFRIGFSEGDTAAYGFSGEPEQVFDRILKPAQRYMVGLLEPCPTVRTEQSAVLGLLCALHALAKGLGIDIYTCLDMNIAKLARRYPNGFSSDTALIRDVDAEYAAMLEAKAA